ncbi:hypothetical protein KEU06_00015 [Pseudaminobacter sp. 19-2017]|uniref:Uncharacterized protein n=1 Tax=Pseudaminobacter soli (ex Zhang et al. 2022) TaxID=2831468 RepID=A0A942DUZ0_9HYPH|nr:hypothetical protein [Pseudaminobacter soli]MBS3647011.1 hypothetical protein [Pseudaminobacter soli]
MFDFDVLEVGIGLALLFAFMSLIATAFCEVIENFAKVRSKELLNGVAELLGDKTDSTLVRSFYEHPMIAALYRGRFDPEKTKHLPSYIPRQSFSLAALRLVTGPDATLSIESLRDALINVKRPNRIQEAVKAALDVADNDIAKVRQTLEEWFDGSMDRVSGWYKRRTGYTLLAMGLLASALFNVDTVLIAERLSNDAKLREAVVEHAGTILGSNNPTKVDSAAQAAVEQNAEEDDPKARIEGLARELSAIGYPIGWTLENELKPAACSQPWGGEYARCSNWRLAILFSIPGWIISALAVTLGAPFWFDMLNKLMVIRSTVKPREKSPDESDTSPVRQAATLGGAQRKNNFAPGMEDSEEQEERAAATTATLIALGAAGNDATFEPHAWRDGQERGSI